MYNKIKNKQFCGNKQIANNVKEFSKMDILKKYFPRAFKSDELYAFIVSLIVYVLIDVVCGVVIGLLSKLPIIGFIFGLAGSLVGLYAFVGIVLSILVFVKVIK